MNTESRERLSALMDDELNASERASTLAQLAESENREHWERWHLIGDAMRGEGWRSASGSIAARVSQALESEPTVLAPGAAKPHTRWVKPAVGSALAASVALLAVLAAPRLIGVGGVGNNATGPTLAEQASVVPQIVSAKPEVKVVSMPSKGERLYSAAQMGTRWTVSEPEVQDRLNKYLVNHQEYAPASNMTVTAPYATIVAYGSSDYGSSK